MKRIKPYSFMMTTKLRGFSLFVCLTFLMFAFVAYPIVAAAIVSPHKLISFLIIVGYIVFGFLSAGLVSKSRTKEINKKAKFEKACKTITATVINRHIEVVEGASNTYFNYHILVQFEADKKQFVIEAKVSKRLYKKAGQKQSLSISYYKIDPRFLLFEDEWLRWN